MNLKPRLVSGIQPTGKMHLGNYWGAIHNWVQLQQEYDAFFLIVDLHSLTTIYQDSRNLREDKLELAVDLLASGVDPEKCCLFFQSDILQHGELHVVLSMITPLGWLLRVPTYKSKIENLQDKNLDTYGFLGYPVLMTADMLLYKAQVVPVGRDQLPHLELAREITRRFNHLFGVVFSEPEEKLTEVPVLPGLDGRKMSKSYGNTIPLSASADDISRLMLKMMTDPQRARRTDPGRPEMCPVYAFHTLYSAPDVIAEVKVGCETAAIGCIDCKRRCAASINLQLGPFREKRDYWVRHTDQVEDILAQGAKRASRVATDTMAEVKAAVGLL
ncbi:MAG: tryptophan--tRNA ligase [Candidatus Margulisiibacteriota bacterium]